MLPCPDVAPPDKDNDPPDPMTKLPDIVSPAFKTRKRSAEFAAVPTVALK
jgi:hypothetical protein